MKTLIALFVATTITQTAFAKIPQGCVRNLNQTIQATIDFKTHAPEMVSKGELTEDGVKELAESWTTVAEMSALLCSGLRKIELQRSLRGHLGLISQKHAEKEAQKSYDQAMSVFNNAVNQ